ncbi:MAG: PHP domain-containing protein [Desulfohalobiaceae bacterium]|nr:PHP domain-containing protein [Desulfohalobiaceae bacterium]
MSEIDLHTHSQASDGSLSPAELVQTGREAGLKALALTDHDTTKGLPEAMAAGRESGLEVIPGCELSVTYPSGFMHILGLWLPATPALLLDKMQYLQKRRHVRNRRIIDALQTLNIDIDYPEVKELAGPASVGRVHIARVLVQKGAVSDIQEAFALYLGAKGRAYFSKDKLGPEEAIRILKQEGATVILAHPYSLELSRDGLRPEIQRLKDLGLDGLEAHSSEHSPQQTAGFVELCREFDLLVSGGSDFHGEGRPWVRLGKGRGNLKLPYHLLESMKEKRRKQGLWVTRDA